MRSGDGGNGEAADVRSANVGSWEVRRSALGGLWREGNNTHATFEIAGFRNRRCQRRGLLHLSETGDHLLQRRVPKSTALHRDRTCTN
jgi:hypothetical protein